MSTKIVGVIGALILIAIVASMALIGGDDDAPAAEADGAFIAGMVPHHQTAIEMAEIARERADHPEIKQLADDIVAAQSSEIEILESAHQRLFDEPVSAADYGPVGLSAEQMGMSMDVSMLETARQFDRAFIDMMIPHHQGAIRMARIELAQGADAETRSLAEAIIDAQSAEIEEMNAWRKQWYGAESPAGGVPAEDEFDAATMGGDGMAGMAH